MSLSSPIFAEGERLLNPLRRHLLPQGASWMCVELHDCAGSDEKHDTSGDSAGGDQCRIRWHWQRAEVLKAAYPWEWVGALRWEEGAVLSESAFAVTQVWFFFMVGDQRGSRFSKWGLWIMKRDAYVWELLRTVTV